MAFALTPQLCGLSSQRLAQLGKLGLTGCSGLEERSRYPHWRGEQTGLRGAHSAEAGWPSKRCPGIGFSSTADREIRVVQHGSLQKKGLAWAEGSRKSSLWLVPHVERP